MGRSRWKFLYVSSRWWRLSFRCYFSKKIKTAQKINTYEHNSAIPPVLLYKYVNIYKGNQFFRKKINKWMVGRKFGEFIVSRKPFYFPIKKKKNLRR